MANIFLRGSKFLPTISYQTEAMPEFIVASSRQLEC
jgi:hypothetical protein